MADMAIKRSGNIWVWIIVPDEKIMEVSIHEWILRENGSVTTSIGGKKVSLLKFLYGSGFRRLDSSLLDFSSKNIYNLDERKELILTDVELDQEWNKQTVEQQEDIITVTIGSWSIFCNKNNAFLVEGIPWNISKRKERVYITASMRLGSRVIMWNLLRLITGLQDLMTGYSTEIGLLYVTVMRELPKNNVIDVRRSNLLILTKGEANKYRTRTKETGIVRKKNGKWTSRLFINNKAIYFGTFSSKEECMEARDTTLKKYNLEELYGGVNENIGMD